MFKALERRRQEREARRRDAETVELHESLSVGQDRLAWFFKGLGQVAVVGGSNNPVEPSVTISAADFLHDIPDRRLFNELEHEMNGIISRYELGPEDVSRSIEVALSESYDPLRYAELVNPRKQ